MRRFWTTKEIAILREWYKPGYYDECRRRLPLRNADCIRAKARVEGFAKRSIKSTPEIDEKLRETYRKTVGTPSLSAFAKSVKRPHWWIRKRAGELGLTMPKALNAVWQPKEIDMLHETAHLTPRSASKHFKLAGFNRSLGAISLRRMIERIGRVQAREDAGIYHASALAEILGVHVNSVSRWHKNHGLPGTRQKNDADLALRIINIKVSDFRKWVIQNPLLVDFSKIPRASQAWFIDLLAGTAGVNVNDANKYGSVGSDKIAEGW